MRRLDPLASALLRPAPSSFSFVMATGVVAIAAHQQGDEWAARAGFTLAAIAWLLLTITQLTRLVRDRDALKAQWQDHARAPGFFTAVAGTAVVASGALMFGFDARIAAALALWAGALWFVLTYGIFTALVTREAKPSLESGLNGAWLLAVVATQSVAVIGALLHRDFIALCMWLAGGVIYMWIAGLVFYRWLFFRFAPSDLAPAYWINMGAMAISTLAGSLLAADAANAPLLHALLPFVEGLTVLCWATATWWQPLLVALGIWRYVVRRDPALATAFDWSMVFPLGMYSAATHQMQNALQLEFLAPVASAFCWIAAAAWLATAAAKIVGD
jgi:tellurite resistance protein TehA-like permease